MAAALVWCWFYHRLTPEHWNQPASFGGDSLIILGGAQAATEGDFTPWMFKAPRRLGAPFGAEWNSWPITEEFLLWTTGIVARLTGLPAATNLVMLAAHALGAAAFYLASRRLGKRRLPSMVCALLFGCSYFIFLRGLGHLTVGYCWQVPLCWMVIAQSFSARGVFKNQRRALPAIGVAVLTGLQNPYYTFIFGQFLGLAFVAQALRRRSWRVVLGPAALGAVLVAAFISMQADTLLDQAVHYRGALSAQRSYADIERYALKPLDLLLPLHWHWPFFEQKAVIYNAQKLVTAEYPMAFLGVAGMVAALLLAGTTLRNFLLGGGGRLSHPVRVYAVPIAWIVLVGMVGGVLGVGSLLTGAYFLRGADRFSIFILALLLFYLADVLTGLIRWRRWAGWAGTVLSLAAAGWELQALRWSKPTVAAIGKEWNDYGSFVTRLEAAAGKGAMLFNLPAVDFPEVLPSHQEDTYAPLQLYVTQPSTLRFSFGNMRGDYRDAWQRTCARLPPDRMVANLRRFGFRGIVVSCAAYPDQAKALLAALSGAAGQPTLLSPKADLAFVLLPPSPAPGNDAPVLPDTANISLARGWWPPEELPTGELLCWTRGDAVIALYRSPSLPPAVPAEIRFVVASPTARTLRVGHHGKELAIVELAANVARSLGPLSLTLKPGWNLLHLRTNQPPARRADVPLDPREIALMVTDIRASGLAPGAAGPPTSAQAPSRRSDRVAASPFSFVTQGPAPAGSIP